MPLCSPDANAKVFVRPTDVSVLPLARFRPFDRRFSGKSLHCNHFFAKRIHERECIYLSAPPLHTTLHLLVSRFGTSVILTGTSPMALILNSLLLSFRVMLRMIVPVLVISIASTVIWAVLGLFTLGMASYVSEPITTAFFTLFGIRAALELKGDTRHTDYRAMALYAVMYELFCAAALTVLTLVVNLSAMAFAMWQVREPLSWAAIQDAADTTQIAFAFIALGSSIIVMSFVLAAFYAVMAVPMASAVLSAGHRAVLLSFDRNLMYARDI
ncbi:hypothetical protein [Ruegeria sp. MALMAid1280]|uniref:hypothetical protein n=1 Tax=Ruegeria sp. MALMAid1280 TaxID=3411634 RepID=UPI003BA30BB0